MCGGVMLHITNVILNYTFINILRNIHPFKYVNLFLKMHCIKLKLCRKYYLNQKLVIICNMI